MANAFDRFDVQGGESPAQPAENPFDAFDVQPEIQQSAPVETDDDAGLFSNSLRNAGERGFDLLGNAIQFIGNAAEKGEKAITDRLGGLNPGMVIDKSDTLRGKGYDPDLEIGGYGVDFTSRVNPEDTDTGLGAAGQAVEDVGLGYKPNFTIDKALDEPTLRNLAGAVAEQGPAALSDMAALIISTPAYLASRTQEIGEARVENDGGDIRNASSELQKAIVDNFANGTEIPGKLQREAEKLAENGGMPGLKDYLVAGPTAAASVLLDRFALGKLLPGGGKAVTSAKQVPGAVGRAVATEATTEAAQEGGIEYAGESVGTQAGWDPSTAGRRAAGGALVGGPTGGVVRGGTATYEAATAKPQQTVDERESVGEGVRMDAEPDQEATDVAQDAAGDVNAFDQFDQPTATAEASAEVSPVEPPVVGVPDDQQATNDDGSPLTESGTGVFRVPVDQIKVDPEQYQFRSRVNEQGVDKRLEDVKRWDDKRAGSVLLHRREDGSMFVADGHHRVDLARRLNQGEINATVIDEADGVSVEQARVEAAMNNIADGKAEPLDVAKVFRDSEVPANEVRDIFNLPSSQVVRDGESLSRLSDNVFGMVAAGQVTEKDGAAIGSAFSEQNQQEAAADAFQKVQPDTEYQRQLLVNEIRAADFAQAQGEQGGLFGDDPQEVSLMQDRLKVLDALRQRLNSDKRLFKSLNDNADRAGEAGNQIATEANESITKQSARSLDLIGRVTTTPALNEMVNRAARRVYDGENRSKVVTELKQELMSYEQGADAEVSGERGQTQGRRATTETRQEPRDSEPVPEQDAAGEDQGGQPESGQQEEVTAEQSAAQQVIDNLNDLNPQLNGVLRIEFLTAEEMAQRPTSGGYVSKAGQNGAVINLRDDAGPIEALEEARHMVDMLLGNREMSKWLKEDKALRDEVLAFLKERKEAGDLAPEANFANEEEIVQAFLDQYFRNPGLVESRFPEVFQFLEAMGAAKYREALQPLYDALAESQGKSDKSKTAPTLDLEAQTEEQLAEQARTREESEQAESDQRRQEQQRTEADSQVDGFALTGSDRTADVAMAAGQDDMFVSTPASRQVEQAGTETDTNPTDGQKEAGNYRKGRVRVQGLDIAIENPKGSTRSGTDPDGNRWESTMAHHYGDIKGTTAADGDNLDVFIGPHPEIDQVFVIDQPNADGTFDEHKVMLGFANEADARQGYLDNYEDGWTVGPTTRMSMDDFKAWMRGGDTTKPLAESGTTQQSAPEESESGSQYSRVGEQEADYDSIQGVRANWSRAGIQHSIRERNSVITVDKIVVPEGMRGDGRGTEAMKLLLDYADRTGQTVALSPSTDFGGRKFRLKRFYRRLGFVENQGGSRNFEISESMLREPKPVDGGQQPAQDGVEGRRSAYRANPNQGDLFTDMESLDQLEQVDAYDNLEVRPDTTQAQRRAGRSALRDFFRQLNARLDRQGQLPADGSGVSLLGAAIYKNFKEGKPNQLIGQTVRSPRDLAALAQVYRDPRFETFRFILTRNGEVISEQAITSRLPAAVSFQNIDGTISDLKKSMTNMSADGYYMLHNHPSGKSVPSAADFAFTDKISREVPGFVQHVVIDTNEYSVIGGKNEGFETIQDATLGSTDFWGNPELPHDVLGTKITSPETLGKIAKTLQQPDRAVFVSTTAKGKVALVTSFPGKTIRSMMNRTAISKRQKEMAAMVRRLRRASGSGGNGFLIVNSEAEAKSLINLMSAGVVRDIIAPNGFSLASEKPRAFRQDVMEALPKKTMRVSEDSDGYDAGRDNNLPPNVKFNGPGIPDLDPQPFGPPSNTLTRYLISKIADKHTVLKGVQQNIQDQFGEIPDPANAYRAEELFHGKVENDVRLIQENMVEPLAKEMSESDVSLKQLDEFLYALHAPERNRVIAERNPEIPEGGSGMTDSEAAAVIAKVEKEGKLKQYQALAKRVHDMLAMRRKILKSAGLEDADTIGAWEESYKNYVPLKGWAADEQQPGMPRAGKGFAIAGKESQMAAGRKSKAASPLANTISDLSEAVLRRRKNEVGQSFMNLVQAYPNDNYWRIYTDENPEVERKAVRVKDPATGKMKVKVREQTIPMAMMSDRYFTTKVDGKTHYIKIEDQRLTNAMRNIGPDNSNLLIRSLAAVTRVMSSLNTSYNPEFVISNFSRDIQTALLNLTSEQSSEDGKARGKKIAAKTLKDVATSIRAINASLKGNKKDGKLGQWQAHFDQFRADGAKTGWFDMKDIDGQMKDLEKMIAVAGGGATNTLRRAFKIATDWVENTNSAIENGVRLSAYVNAIEAGIPRSQAASLAKNMTVNFNRKGELGTMMNALYMFANASVQGTANFVRTLGRLNGVKGDPIWRRMHTAQKIAVGMAVGGFALSMLNRLVAGEDDDEVNWWDKVPDYIKERNIVIMKSLVGGEPGEYWTIPLPYGYNIFPVLGTQMEHMAFSDSQSAGKAATNIIMAALGSFSPIGFEQSEEIYGVVAKNIWPTILRPVASISLNENFMGGPIYKENFPFGTQKPDSALYFRSTPEAFKALAEDLNDATGGSEFRSGAVDLSPDVMQFLVGYYGGGSYNFFTSRTPNFLQKVATGVELEDREIPFLRKVSGKVLPYEDQSKFYDRRNEIQQLVDERKALKGRERIEFIKDYRDKLRLQPIIDSTEKRLKMLREQRDRIELMDLSASEEDKRLQQVERQMKRAIDQFNKRYNEADD
ncbi:hypothetical protein O4H29_06760 [Marinobacter salarius]|uniref:LPD38 domain-containing protein n=1 Tax=Marinobacter salarius TaxID=1420917 RepID=UPI0022B08EC2|nr:LPD38 domain-containing protein [Marinobacter salarius]MCZ4284533.1 hypothetical protein [Marinobacter salarius]